jgi:hypothetical protein
MGRPEPANKGSGEKATKATDSLDHGPADIISIVHKSIRANSSLR